MSLRLKSSAIIAACMVVLMAMLYAVFHFLVTTRFSDIEQAETRRNVARVEDAIGQELGSLNSKAGDWANWDDIYWFVQGENPDFLTSNIADGTFEQLRISLILVVASDGRLVYGGAFDLDRGEQTPLPDGLLEYLTPDNPLLQHAAESGELTGLVNLPNVPLLVASRPIHTSAWEGPSPGTLIFGRYLDATEQTQLAEQTHLSLQFRRYADPGLPADFEAAARSLQLEPVVHVAALSRESIAGYDVLEDIQGDPALLLRVDDPRPVYQQGQVILLTFGAVILVMGGLAGVIIGIYQQRLLLSRLEKAEDRHRAVVEQTAEAFLLIDPEGMRVIDANRAFYRLFGFSPDEMSKLTLYDLDSGSRGEIDAAWRLACQGDQQSSSSREWRHNDGRVVDVEIGASPITLGKRRLMSCVVRDVSERRKAELALRSSEERFRGVFENTLIGIYQIAPDGRVLFANRALAQMLGFRTPEDMVQGGLDQNDGSALPGRSLRRRIDEAGEIRGHVSFWETPDGSTTRARENARAVRDPSGAVRYYEGTVEDITELVDAQEELRRRARHLEALNSVIAAGGNASDAPGMMNACLDSTLKALGLNSGAVWAGEHQRFVGLSDDFGRALDGLGSAFDKTLFVADGSEIPTGHPLHALVGPMTRSGINSWLAFPVMSQGKRIGGMALASMGPRVWRVEEASLGEVVASQLGAGLERIQIAEQTHHQERLAAIGQLAAGIAHDFNNILEAIILHAGLLMREPGLPPRGVQRTRTILEQGQFAATLVSQVLDFSRRSLLHMQPMDLLVFLREKLKLIERTLPETIRPVLVAEEGEYPLLADFTRIQQILVNLSTNARDAMPAGGSLTFSLRKISVAPEDHRPFPDMPAGNWLVLGVADTGLGMPDEVKSHLFEPFFTTKAPGEGTGLALSQVYGIVKQHNGYVDVSSMPGIGTTFTIFFPALAAGAAEEVVPSLGVGQGAGETLLLVEDQQATREAITDVLEGLGYNVICAENGREALKRFQENQDRIQLVISDMVMPELGGEALYEDLAQRRPGLKMILMTGYPVGGTGQLQAARGIVRLQKPMTADGLAAAVRAALGAQPDDAPRSP